MIMPDWTEDEIELRDVADVIPPSAPDPRAWRTLDLVGNANNPRPRKSKRNVGLILELDSRWRGTIYRNAFDGLIYVKGEPITDATETAVAVWLDRVYGIDVATATISEVIRLVASRHERHPVRDYLDGLAWDGVERCKRLLAGYMGGADTPLNRVLSRCFLVSCVARVRQPGCKVDTVLILVGRQGTRKSTALETLAGHEWFSDSEIDMGSRDGYAGLCGVWIQELGELDSLNRKEAATAKAFLSGRRDRYRPAYGRNFVTVERQTVVVGSTNEETFLKDPTGSRRFWPAQVGSIDIEALERDRDQLWAEAQALYAAGWTWWLWPEQATELQEASEKYQDEDVWEPMILDYVALQREVTVAEVLAHALKFEPDRMSKGAQMRVASVLQRAGMHKVRPRESGRRTTKWVK